MARGGLCGPLFMGVLVVFVALVAFQLHNSDILEIYSSVENGMPMISHFNDGGNHLHEQEFANCSSILTESARGSEDFAVYSSTRILLSSSDHTTLAKEQVTAGGIFELDIVTKEIHKVEIVGFNEEQNVFHPHGISIYRDVDGPTLLFVVNHRHKGQSDQVLVFQFNPDERILTHVDTIESDLFVSLNDIVAVGLQQFFVTNDSGYTRDSPWKLWEFLIPFQSGSTVVYYDGENASVAVEAGKISFANGINVSLGKKYLFVSGTTDKSIHMYDLQLERKSQFIVSASLRPRRVVYVGMGVDNIEVDIVDGSLWVAGHPIMAKFLGHAFSENNEKPSPSKVVHINHIDAIRAENVLVETVFVSDGSGDDGISASSTAARVGPIGQQLLLISPVFEGKLLLCPSVAERAVGL